MSGPNSNTQNASAFQAETKEEVLRDVKIIQQAFENQPELTQEIKDKYWINNDPLPRHSQFASYLGTLAWEYRQGIYRARTWGYTIIRTVYGDGDGDEWDTKFQNALSAIRRSVQAQNEYEINRITAGIQQYVEWGRWPKDYVTMADRRIETEFEKRFINEVLQDRELFANASVDQVRAYFLRWAQEHFARFHPLAAARGVLFRNCEPGSPRLFACIILDAETVEQLQGVPESPAELYPRLREFWVKMVEAQPLPRDGWLDSSMCDCYRVRLGELADFWFDRADQNPFRKTDEPDPQDASIRYYNYGSWTPPELRGKIGLTSWPPKEKAEPVSKPDLDPKPNTSKPDTSQFWGSVLNTDGS